MFTVKYYTGLSGGTDITTSVTGGTFLASNLAPGGSQVIRAVVTSGRNAAVGTALDCLVTAASVADTTKSDAVKARTTVK